MKVSLNWLKEYVDITLPVVELAERLTMAGFEVKGIEVIGGSWENVVIGRLKAVNPHPNADRLRLTTVDLGGEEETVICGAPNLNVGDKVVFARLGARLIDPYDGKVAILKAAKIRGVASSGMVCSEKELGISDRHEGILVLSEDAPVGVPLADYLGDTVLNIDVTPNRPDCLSIIGIAREIAALTGQSLHSSDVSYDEVAPPSDEQIEVEIVDSDLCPRYCATLVKGVKIAESPAWMQQRLLACGMRPIVNIVDVTNYVMLEYGQPLHSFDYNLIRGQKIIVRRAGEGEEIVTLDGEERTLSGDTLVIADGKRAVAIAGVMGGANSEVADDTTSILLEAASFNAASIHFTGSMLNLPSEACMRFERGISPEMTLPALKRATQLIAQLGGAEVARGLVDVYPGKQEPEPIKLSTAEIKRYLGLKYSIDQIVNSLASLGFDCKPGGSATEVMVTAPWWRSDISQAVDLIEEVARITGYDRIPMTMLSDPIPRQNPDPVISLGRELRSRLTGYGFQEIITYSLVGLEALRKLKPQSPMPEPMPLRVDNPMTAEQEYLRPNLRANLLSALAANRRHEDGAIRLFELGRVYLPRRGDLPEEPDVLCGLLTGSKADKSWLVGNETVDFFEVKGVVEGLLHHLGVAVSFEPCSGEGLNPAKRAAVVADGRELGLVGELHPRVLENFEVTEAAYLFEISLAALLPPVDSHRRFRPIPRFPATVRDIALVVDDSVTHRQVLDIIEGSPLVEAITLFDVYSGEQVPEGKKSLAYRITFQSPTDTLTDKEVDKVQQQILERLARELSATLRT